MRKYRWFRMGLAGLTLGALVSAQQVAPPIMVLPQPRPEAAPPAPAPARPEPAQAEPAKPGAPAPQAPKPVAQGTLTDAGGFVLQNVSLVELVDILAKRLKINYILDPRVKGSVTVNTYGEVRPADLMTLLQTILRINGASMVKVGDLYRIVPVAEVARLPIPPTVNGRDLPDDESTILNLVFLKYATVEEMAKLLEPFIGEGARLSTYPPANLLLMLDNARNMRRTMELLAMFDSDTFAGQRVRLMEVKHGRPQDIAKELESVFKAYALSEKSSSVKFLPVDRINTIIAVAPNPGIFVEVDKWLKKLDIPVKVTAGAVDNYVYRLKYGRAETVAMAIMALYSGNPMALAGMAAMGMGGMGMGMGMGGGMYGGGMYGGGMYGGGMYGGGMYGAGMYGGGMYGAGMYGGGMYGGGYGATPFMSTIPMTTTPPAAGQGTTPSPAAAAGQDLTGSYLGAAAYGMRQRIPHVIPNPFDNTLLVQATPQEWESISKLLRQLDVPPRQVLIEAKIYEVDLSGEFSSGVAAFLNRRGEASTASGDNGGPKPPRLSRTLLGDASGAGLNLTAGLLVGRSRELLGLLTMSESTGRSKVISEPSVIATDSVPASINVGSEVPTLSSSAVTGIQQGGSSLFANTITNRSTGVNLTILARVNSSGVVTLVINQDVSAPAPAPPSIAGTAVASQSPSFSKRNVQTQVTVQDNDTIAIGGIVQESDTHSSAGVPVLHRIPVLGAAFGSRNVTKSRTELVVFLTPRVIYDTNQIADATDELTSRLKQLRRMIKDE